MLTKSFKFKCRINIELSINAILEKLKLKQVLVTSQLLDK